MPDWTIEIETEFTGLDEEGLVRFADAFERGFGYMGPSCSLHEGRLGFTVTVTAATVELALQSTFAAANEALRGVGVVGEEEVEVVRLNAETMSEREFALA